MQSSEPGTIPRGCGRAHRRGDICMGAGLHLLMRSLGVKSQEKGMDVMCSGNCLFLVKGTRRAQGASFGPTVHEFPGLALWSPVGYFHDLVSVLSAPEPQTACHCSEPKLQVKVLSLVTWETHSLSTPSPQQRPGG